MSNNNINNKDTSETSQCHTLSRLSELLRSMTTAVEIDALPCPTQWKGFEILRTKQMLLRLLVLPV